MYEEIEFKQIEAKRETVKYETQCLQSPHQNPGKMIDGATRIWAVTGGWLVAQERMGIWKAQQCVKCMAGK